MWNKWIIICILFLAILVGIVFWKYPVHIDTANNSVTVNTNSTVSTGVEEITPTTLPPSKTPPSAPASEQPTSHNLPPTTYPLHTNITATVFWVGEPVGDGSSENNAISAWDDEWQKHFGCFDNPEKRNGYFPTGCTPKENPFYLDLPYNDFADEGDRRPNAFQTIPWAKEKTWGAEESLMKNQWVKIIRNGIICYGQIEDAGPYAYDDAQYVFGTHDERPKNTKASSAGMDVSPALRDCLKFQGLNNDENKVSWQFVKESEVPTGPWKQLVTTSQINWK